MLCTSKETLCTEADRCKKELAECQVKLQAREKAFEVKIAAKAKEYVAKVSVQDEEISWFLDINENFMWETTIKVRVALLQQFKKGKIADQDLESDS